MCGLCTQGVCALYSLELLLSKVEGMYRPQTVGWNIIHRKATV